MIEDRVCAIMNSLGELDAMDQRADYLTRGRQLAHLSDDALARLYASTFGATIDCNSDENRRRYNDANAELTVRGQEPPYDMIQADLNRFRDMVRGTLVPGQPEYEAMCDNMVAAVMRRMEELPS